MTLYKKDSKGEVVKQIQKSLHLYPDGIFGVLTEEAVREYQYAHGLNVDGIVGPATLSSIGIKIVQQYFRLKKSRRTIDEIIVHCSATPEGSSFTVEDIRRWHKLQGWSDIGYHYVIYLDGSIHSGRDVDIVGAHCTGHNQHSIGVCYIGGVSKDNKTPKDTRTEAQKAALLSLLVDLKKLYPDAEIHSHRDYANKACPSFDATKEYKNL